MMREEPVSEPKPDGKPFVISCVLETVFDLPVGVRPQ
jgi:hypothetical protein